MDVVLFKDNKRCGDNMRIKLGYDLLVTIESLFTGI